MLSVLAADAERVVGHIPAVPATSIRTGEGPCGPEWSTLSTLNDCQDRLAWDEVHTATGSVAGNSAYERSQLYHAQERTEAPLRARAAALLEAKTALESRFGPMRLARLGLAAVRFAREKQRNLGYIRAADRAAGQLALDREVKMASQTPYLQLRIA